MKAAVLLALAAHPLVAQETSRDTARVTPVVVSATRTPMSVSHLPVAVTVITADELRLKGITTVADALADVSSAAVAQSGSPGAQTSVFLRGGESKYVKVLIDGVPANDPGGVYDFASLTTDNVERIEIVRGPASVVHGADAVTGVVHVITRRGRGPGTTDAMLRVGAAPRQRISASGPAPDAMSVVDASAGVSGQVATGAYSIALARHTSTGLYELNNDYSNNVLSGRFHFAPAGGTDVRLALRYTDARFNYPTNGGGTVVDSNAMRSEDRTVLGIEAERRLTAGVRAVLALNSSVNDGGTDDRMDAAGGSSFISQDKVRRRGADLRVHALARGAAVTIGAQVEQQDQRSQLQSQSPFGPFTSEFRAARRSNAAYGEAVVTRGQVSATLGARVDDNERFGTFGTARAGVSWRPLTAARVRVTTGTAFREPSFFENYATGFVTGNPGLRPERTIGTDAGVDWTVAAGRAELSASGFAQRFADMIDYEPTSAACGFSYCNVARATANGLEFEARGRLRGPLQAGVAATLLRTRVTEPGYDSSSAGLYRRNQALIRRPERKVTGEVRYAGAGRIAAYGRILAVGVRHDRDFRPISATPVVLGSYERVDVGGEYSLSLARTRSAVTLRIENLGDRVYQNVFNFLAPRRTVSLGVRSVF